MYIKYIHYSSVMNTVLSTEHKYQMFKSQISSIYLSELLWTVKICSITHYCCTLLNFRELLLSFLGILIHNLTLSMH